MSVFRMPAPAWFRVVAIVLLVWGLVGVGGFVADRLMSDEAIAALPEYDRNFRAAQPGWTVWAYGIATVTGLLGSALLLLGKRSAQGTYVVSLVAVVLLFGYVLAATDIVAAKGFVGAAGFPIVIVAIAVFQVRLAEHAIRRGWIG